MILTTTPRKKKLKLSLHQKTLRTYTRHPGRRLGDIISRQVWLCAGYPDRESQKKSQNNIYLNNIWKSIFGCRFRRNRLYWSLGLEKVRKIPCTLLDISRYQPFPAQVEKRNTRPGAEVDSFLPSLTTNMLHYSTCVVSGYCSFYFSLPLYMCGLT